MFVIAAAVAQSNNTPQNGMGKGFAIGVFALKPSSKHNKTKNTLYYFLDIFVQRRKKDVLSVKTKYFFLGN